MPQRTPNPENTIFDTAGFERWPFQSDCTDRAETRSSRLLCYLKASTPPEPADDEVLLSSEEWKNKQLEVHKELAKDSDNGVNQRLLALT